MYKPYDPTISYFKSRPGAVAAGETLRFTVIFPRDFQVSYCWLAVNEDGRETRWYPMTWGSTDGREENWYVDFTPDHPAPLFYRFEYENPWGRTYIRHDDDSLVGSFCGQHEWQLTVYDPSFVTPDEIKGGVIYQIFPDRFYNSGSPKENVPADRVLRADRDSLPCWQPDDQGKIKNNDYFGGDLQGVTEKLDYIRSLGTTIIYLNPICEAHSNHRYDTADYLKVDPLLGTEEDFRTLCAQAHKRGMKVILDGVFSHTGADSVYFNKFGRYGRGGAYNDRHSPYRSWYTFGKKKDDYKSWWNIDILPEVNENDPSFTEFITGEGGVIDHWLGLGADGYRLDVADELPDEFIDRVRTAVKRNGADKYLLGEVWEDATDKISHGGRRRFLLGKQLDGVMNYPFRRAIIDFLLTGDAETCMARLYAITDHYPPQAMHVCMNHLGTHDTERILSVLAGVDCEGMTREEQAALTVPPAAYERAVRLFRMAVWMNYTLPGIPSVYYGDEAGMTGCKDPFNRCCYPWGKENPATLSLIRSAGNFRKNQAVLKDGGFYPISAAEGCVAWLRYAPGTARVFVAANKNDREIEYRLHDDMRDMEPVIGGTKVRGGVIIPPETCAVLVDNEF
ncbi:MAG: glycoside hydrolase family 13 protein [Clostridia bacterium]|nr:glycoside hydrolase family 13 protein [Clostridia bacterium]